MGKCLGFAWMAAGAAFFGCLSAQADVSCARPWLYFDLGNTVLKTTIDPQSNDISEISYMPEVRNYLLALKNKGYHLGLIVNVPEGWGGTRPEKIGTLKKVVSEKWRGESSMDWTVFDLGILVPPTDRQRKPQPFLFEEALERAKKSGCDAVFQGETPREVATATQVGLHGFEIGRPGHFFLPEAEIAEFIKE